MGYEDYALIKKSTLTSIGDAIRAQNGTTDLIDPANFGTAIAEIEGTGGSGSGGGLLQEKSVTTNGEVTPDEGYYGLSKVTVNVETTEPTEPTLQDKTITINGEYTADEGYDGLGKVTVAVPASSGADMENAFTVNFYDYENELIESHTAKIGNQIGSPLSFMAGRWQDADEYVYSFPITLDTAGSVINLYAIAETLVDELYSFYCIDKETYPLVFINVIQGSYWEIFLYFGKTFTSNGDNIITMTDVVGYKLSTTSDVITPIYENRDDVSFVIKSVFDNIAVSNLTTGATAQGKSAETENFALYTNFDTDLTRNTDSIYRLDAQQGVVSLINKFYIYFGVDVNEYPYFHIASWYSSATQWMIKPIFFKTISDDGVWFYDCLVMSSNENGYGGRYIKSITSEEYGSSNYSDISLIYDVLTEGGATVDKLYNKLDTDNDTNNCWYFGNYDDTYHTNWTDLRTV